MKKILFENTSSLVIKYDRLTFLIFILMFWAMQELHSQASSKVPAVVPVKNMKEPLSIKGIVSYVPAFEDIAVYRIQLKLTTGRGNDAGTDEGVYVQFNDFDNKFYLSKGIDNFEEGHTDTYDVLTETVKHVRDIQYMRFGVKGDDGWCMKKVELFLNDNDVPVFTKEYSGRGSCMDNKGTFTISSSELRSSAFWAYAPNHKNIWQPPTIISKDMIKSLVECSVGNQLTQESGFAWGTSGRVFNTLWGDAVEYKKVNINTLHFDLDLQRTLNGPNPEVDVDFDLKFNCVNGVIVTNVKNLTCTSNLVGKAQDFIREKGFNLIGKAIGAYFGNEQAGDEAGTKASGLLSRFLSYGINFNVQNPGANSGCKAIRIAQNGDIYLN